MKRAIGTTLKFGFCALAACSHAEKEQLHEGTRWPASETPRTVLGVETWAADRAPDGLELRGLDGEGTARVRAHVTRGHDGRFSVTVDVPTDWSIAFVPGQRPNVSRKVPADVALALASSALDAPRTPPKVLTASSSSRPLDGPDRAPVPLVETPACLLGGPSDAEPPIETHRETIGRTFAVVEEEAVACASGEEGDCVARANDAACAQRGPEALIRVVDGAVAALTRAAPGDPVPRELIPDGDAFREWRDDTQSVSGPPPQEVEPVQLICPDRRLFPSQPDSGLKNYHRYAHGRYDHFKLSGDSEACEIAAPKRSSGQRRCLKATSLDYAMLSDTYADSCGNYYRGYWDETYLARDETMGTLMSKGRRVYEVPRSQFKGEVYDDGTYAVPADDFAFLGALLPGDAERIARARAKAIENGTHRYDPETGTFEYIGPHRPRQ